MSANDQTTATARDQPAPPAPVSDDVTASQQTGPPAPSPPSTDPPTVPASATMSGDDATEGAPALPGHTPLRKLGEGTYGQVWLYQEDNAAGRRVAVKFLACRSNQQWLLLQGEVRQLALLDTDPGIIGLRRVEPDQQPPYYVMNYAEGGSLSQRLSQGALPVPEAIGLFRQIVRAMAFVHANGVRHCDLKPGNILLDKMGRPLLADFGQSHLETDRSPVLGTFFYMAPEQADLANTAPDPRWDVYALGALLYAMLTGQPPRADAEVRAQLGQVPRLAPRLRAYREYVWAAPRPELHRKVKGVDGPLADLIDRCLALDPRRRPRDAGEVRDSLERWLRRRRQRPVLGFALVLPVLLLAAMGGFASWATTDAVGRSETALTEQLQESDLTAARLVANVVEGKLEERRRVVANVSRQPNLSRTVAGGDPEQIRGVLKGFHENRSGFDAWFLADAEGNVLAHYPNGVDGLQQRNFAWRDWFHGQGERPRGQKPGLPPVRRPHVSQPYVGDCRPGTALAVSAPVYHPDDRARARPIAVVVARFPADELHDWTRQVPIRGGHVVLLTERYECLLHPQMNDWSDGPPARATFEDCPFYRRLVEERQPCKDCCADPLDGHPYLMSGAPAAPGRADGEARWGVVVQHRKQEALQPIGELERRLWVIGTCSLVSAAVLTLALWAWLIWALRREEAGAHG